MLWTHSYKPFALEKNHIRIESIAQSQVVEDTGFDFQEKEKEERREKGGGRKRHGSDLSNTIGLLDKLKQTEC